MIIEANNVQIPAELNSKFFSNIVENGLRKINASVETTSFSMGSSIGDNFCSKIYRVIIKYRNHNSTKLDQISVIIKSMPIAGHTQFLEDLHVFQKEKIVFLEILPRLEFLLENVKFGSRCYHTLKEPTYTIVFEDLKTLGFMMGNRSEGLDFEHSKIAIEKLAKFHASSMLLAKKDPDILPFFSKCLMDANVIRNSQSYQKIFGGNLEALTNASKKWTGYEKISEKLKKMQIKYIEMLEKVTQVKEDELMVLNHGDLWVNNIMFKYDEINIKRPIDSVFVDYQMSFYGSPGIDLNYFFNTSLHIDVLRTGRNKLLKIYYDSLKTTLIEFKSLKIPSFEKICEEVKRKEFYGFGALFGIFPVISASSDKNSIENLSTDEEFMKNLLETLFSANKRIVEVMQFSLKRFDDLGILDQ